MKQLYVLTYKWSLSEFWTYYYFSESMKFGSAKHCPTCGGAVSAKEHLSPLEFELECKDRGFGDIAFGAMDDVIVSQRFRNLWEAEGLTGITEFTPTTITSVKRCKKFSGDPPSYFLAKFVWSSALINEAASQFKRPHPIKCDVCRDGIINGYDRIEFYTETLEDFDVFHPVRLRGLKVVSERYKEFKERNKITNSLLVPCEVYGDDWKRQP
jgi:hypothetical protein